MKIDVIDKTGKAVEKIALSESVFGVVPNETLLSQYIRVITNNRRQGTASAKTRGEVTGSGAKPWRQKGTGRARVGSKRTPLWRHGGITHGPKPKSWNLSLPKKMKKAALAGVLSQKVLDTKISVVSDLSMKTPKTAELQKLVKKMGIQTRKTLLVLDKNDISLRKSVSNIPWLKTALVDNLNAYEVLLADRVVFVKKAINLLQERYENK